MLRDVIQSQKLVVFIGVGSRSVRAAKALLERQCRVRILERRTYEEFLQAWRGPSCPSSEQLCELGVIWAADGESLISHLDGVTCAILSPGVSVESSVVGTLSRLHIPMYSHVELDLFLGERTSVLVTGTNGKTTTARMISTMIMHASNVNTSPTSNFSSPSTSSAQVFTASAYEIEGSSELKPFVAACINAFPAYLERYGTSERYLMTLHKAFERQDAEAFRVINLDDGYTGALHRGARSQLVGVSRFDSPTLRDECRYFVQIGDGTINVNDLQSRIQFQLPPSLGFERHNRYNAAMAVGIAWALRVPEDAIQRGLLESAPVLYRQNWSELGVMNIPVCNDAKSTNVYATRAALEVSVGRYPDRKVVLLIGGVAVEGDWLSLLNDFRSYISDVICYGTDGALLATYCDVAKVESIRVNSFGEAVEAGVLQAGRGGNRTLVCSPGCLSLDEFSSFDERGSEFDRRIHLSRLAAS